MTLADYWVAYRRGARADALDSCTVLERALFDHLVMEANHETGQVYGSLTAHAAELGASRNSVKAAAEGLEAKGRIRCFFTRGHEGLIEVVAYFDVVHVDPEVAAVRRAIQRERIRARADQRERTGETSSGRAEQREHPEVSPAPESFAQISASARADQREERADQREPTGRTRPTTELQKVVVEAIESGRDMKQRFDALTDMYIGAAVAEQRPKGFTKGESAYRRGIRKVFVTTHSPAEVNELLRSRPHLSDKEILHELEPDMVAFRPSPVPRASVELDESETIDEAGDPTRQAKSLDRVRGIAEQYRRASA